MKTLSPPKYSIPLVSVVVVNYNYGRFLRAAVDSVLRQTYPDIECLIIDDASTDESPEILDSIAAAHTDIRIIRRAKNGGQVASFLDGFANSQGAYLVFLDADDILFEDFVALHTYVHLSLRDPVGFSCSDMIQLDGDRMVLGGFPPLGSYVASAPGHAPTRPLHISTSGQWIETINQSVLEKVYRVDPAQQSWPWSATSAFFFRRDALNLWTKAPALANLRRSPDAFFGWGINAITGSVVIDESLGAYRVHGTNIFSRSVTLAHLRHFDPESELSTGYKRLLLDEITRDPARFAFHVPDQILAVLDALDVPPSDAPASGSSTGSYAVQCVKRNYARLVPVVGKRDIDAWLFRQNFLTLKKKIARR